MSAKNHGGGGGGGGVVTVTHVKEWKHCSVMVMQDRSNCSSACDARTAANAASWGARGSNSMLHRVMPRLQTSTPVPSQPVGFATVYVHCASVAASTTVGIPKHPHQYASSCTFFMAVARLSVLQWCCAGWPDWLWPVHVFNQG